MSLPLADPIAAYFRAHNAHDVEGMLAAFAHGSTVRDEGRDMFGRDAIRTWIDDTTHKYHPSVMPLDVEQVDGSSVVKARVSGTFRGVRSSSAIDSRSRAA